MSSRRDWGRGPGSRGPNTDVGLESVPVRLWVEGRGLPEQAIVLDARLRGVVREEHGHVRLVFRQGQGLDGVVCDPNSQKRVPRLQPCDKVDHPALRGVALPLGGGSAGREGGGIEGGK